MSSFTVQLKIAADSLAAKTYQEELSPTLYDGFVPPPNANSLPVDELRIRSLDDIFSLLHSHDPINAKTIQLDLRGFEKYYSQLLVYLSPILYRWTGQELVVIPPEQGDFLRMYPALADLLRSLELRARGIRIISCPTCARCRTGFPEMVKSIEDRLARMDRPLDIAVMGCEVNGPGEARAADIGIAFGDQKGMLFKNGKQVRVVTIEEAADVLLNEIETL